MSISRNVRRAMNWLAEQNDEVAVRADEQALDLTSYPIRMADGRWRSALPIIVPRSWNQDDAEERAATERKYELLMDDATDFEHEMRIMDWEYRRVRGITVNGVEVTADDLAAMGDFPSLDRVQSQQHLETDSDLPTTVGMRRAVISGSKGHNSRISRREVGVR